MAMAGLARAVIKAEDLVSCREVTSFLAKCHLDVHDFDVQNV